MSRVSFVHLIWADHRPTIAEQSIDKNEQLRTSTMFTNIVEVRLRGTDGKQGYNRTTEPWHFERALSHMQSPQIQHRPIEHCWNFCLLRWWI